ncbi:hypothetical protein lbkm_2220 [Lachnospiraceae bacterium KM106-2]|nr:hypothetical protein lbkm_2220 [Lachnospiraceae bacterium KM106-2]
MYYKFKAINNTVSLNYQHIVDPGVDPVVKQTSSTATTQSKTLFDSITYTPIKLDSLCHFPTPGCRSLYSINTGITTDHTIRTSSSQSTDYLLVLYTLYTNSVWFNEDIYDYEINCCKKHLQVSLKIPSHYKNWIIEYHILDSAMKQVTPCEALSSSLLSIFLEADIKRDANLP